MTPYKKYGPAVLSLGGAAITCLLPSNPDHWRSQILIGSIVFSVLIGFAVAKKLDAVVGFILGVFLILSLMHAGQPGLPYQHFGMVAAQKIALIESRSLWFFLIIVLSVLYQPPRWTPLISSTLGWLCLGNSIFMIGSWAFHHRMIGALNNSSLDGTMVAILFPFLIRNLLFLNWRYGLLLALPVIAAFLSKSSTAVLVMGFVLMMQTGAISILAAPLMFLSWWLWDNDFFSSSMRFDIWRLVMDYWVTLDSTMIGAGPGTFLVFGPHVQIVNQYRVGTYFIWAHNDWLQITFEYGFIGLASILTLFVYLYRQCRGDRFLKTILIAYGLAAFTQPMIRLLPTAFIGAFLVRLIVEKRKSK